MGGGTGTAQADEEEKDRESYLLGKEFDSSGKGIVEGSLGALVGTSKVDDVVNTQSQLLRKEGCSSSEVACMASRNEEIPNDWNEEFRLKYEDPMFEVKQKKLQREREKEKKQKLYEQVLGSEKLVFKDQEKGKNRGRHKRTRKERSERRLHDGEKVTRDIKPKHKNRSKRHHHTSRNQRENYSDRGGKDNRHYHLSPRRTRHRHRHSRRPSQSRSRSFSHSRSDSRSRSHSRSRNHNHSRSHSPCSNSRNNVSFQEQEKDKTRHHDRRYSRDNVINGGGSRQSSINEKTTSLNKRQNEFSLREVGPSRESPPNYDELRPDKKEEHITNKNSRYGLQGGLATSKVESTRSDCLGPDKTLLKKKREEKQLLVSRHRGRGRRQHCESNTLLCDEFGRSTSRISKQYDKTTTQERNIHAINSMKENAKVRENLLHLAAAKASANAEDLIEEVKRRCNKGEAKFSNGTNDHPLHQAKFLKDIAIRSSGIGDCDDI